VSGNVYGNRGMPSYSPFEPLPAGQRVQTWLVARWFAAHSFLEGPDSREVHGI
jgi:hypothetical protein